MIHRLSFGLPATLSFGASQTFGSFLSEMAQPSSPVTPLFARVEPPPLAGVFAHRDVGVLSAAETIAMTNKERAFFMATCGAMGIAILFLGTGVYQTFHFLLRGVQTDANNQEEEFRAIAKNFTYGSVALVAAAFLQTVSWFVR